MFTQHYILTSSPGNTLYCIRYLIWHQSLAHCSLNCKIWSFSSLKNESVQGEHADKKNNNNQVYEPISFNIIFLQGRCICGESTILLCSSFPNNVCTTFTKRCVNPLIWSIYLRYVILCNRVCKLWILLWTLIHYVSRVSSVREGSTSNWWALNQRSSKVMRFCYTLAGAFCVHHSLPH